MEGFQKIVLISAIVILIIALVLIGMALSSGEEAWPPIKSDCPDYWVSDGSGNASICTNVKDLGTCPPREDSEHLVMNFNGSAFTGSEGDCNKYKWADKCNISWDGITYGVSNPCDTAA